MKYFTYIKKLLKTNITLAVALVLVLGSAAAGAHYISAQSTGSFTEPTATPPLNNTPPPINVSSSAQSKAGSLAIGTSNDPASGYALDVEGNAFATGLGVAGNGVITGQLGVGTTNANVHSIPFQVHGATDVNVGITYGNLGGNTTQARISGYNDDGSSNIPVDFQASEYHFLGNFGNTEPFTIASTGNVGINNTTPALPLTVNGKVGATAYCDQTGANCITPGSGGSTGGDNWTANGTNIYNSNTGRVLIGASTNNASGFKLDVYGNGPDTIRATGNSNNAVGIYVNNSLGRQWGLLSSGGGPSSLGDFTVWDDTAQAARLNIDSSGNVTVPSGYVGASSFCDVTGTHCLNPASGGLSGGIVNILPKWASANTLENSDFADDGTNDYAMVAGTGASSGGLDIVAQGGGYGNLFAGIANVENLSDAGVSDIGGDSTIGGNSTITGNETVGGNLQIAGNIGIGGTANSYNWSSDQTKLIVDGKMRITDVLIVNDPSVGGGAVHLYSGAQDPSQGGYVGVSGIPNSTGDSAYMQGIDGSVNAAKFCLAGICKTTWGSGSDIRLKQDIAPLQSALADIMKLQPVTYEYKDQTLGKGEQVGLIAQDVQKIYPQVVETDSKGMESIDYGNLVSPLIKAVQEQQAEIQTLQDENASLTARVTNLENSSK